MSRRAFEVSARHLDELVAAITVVERKAAQAPLEVKRTLFA